MQLKDIKSPEDLKKAPVSDLKALASEIRHFLLENVSETGGHLSSNLGVVELTMALHYVFDSPKDKLIWDVGHQGYVHKILTGRQEGFKTLRKYKGMSGFLKSHESIHDVFDAGHSSTSISAALGYAKAAKVKGLDYKSVAIIGDGALSAGMAFEAINYAGHSKENIIVVLNDNEMSISENVGAVSSYLNKIRTTRTYLHFKIKTQKILKKVPLIGTSLLNFGAKLKRGLKQFVVKGMLFEEFGFTYVGVVDGHNINRLIDVFDHVKDIPGPILIHVATEKGKGYNFAEKSPSDYHGVGVFDVKAGIVKTESKSKYQDILGSKLIEMRHKNDSIIAITAAMSGGTGLSEFSEIHKDSFVDVGIAEQNAVTMAAGMAMGGLKPYVCIYSTFLQRAYDQVLHDVCIQNLNVVFCIDRAGLVGEDGETHHGVFDLSYLSHMPNMTVLSPKDDFEFKAMLDYSLIHKGPLAIRYPRGKALSINEASLNNNQPEILQKGDDGILIAVGHMVGLGLEVVEDLKNYNIHMTLINPRQIFPVPLNLLNYLNEKKNIFTLEDNTIIGGYGAYLSTVLVEAVTPFALSHTFIEHGDVKKLYQQEGLDVKSLVKKIKEILETSDDQ